MYIPGKPIDLIGRQFDRLTVVSKVRRTRSGSLWLCRCACGEMANKYTGQLHKVRNTGCRKCEHHSRAAVHATHGGTVGGKSCLYVRWKGMHSRCRMPSDTSYRYYGGKGIRVCDAWATFDPFQEWALSHGFRDGLSLDRLDPEDNYFPENCEWVTRSENSRRAVITTRARRAAEKARRAAEKALA